MLHYDEPKLIKSLETLPNFARVAFAAACAERQMVNYARVTTRSYLFQLVASALEAVWTELMGTPTSDEAVRRHLADCMSALAEPDSLEAVRTDNPIASVAYALRTRLSANSQEAAWAARQAFEALDAYVNSRLNTTEFTPEIERRILADPLVQAELKRQERDLSDLVELMRNHGDAKLTIASLRERAREAAENFMR